jgi:hypothetical protein
LTYGKISNSSRTPASVKSADAALGQNFVHLILRNFCRTKTFATLKPLLVQFPNPPGPAFRATGLPP